MAITIEYNSLAVTNKVPLPFSATGGTTPYTWSVITGGAGGTINSSTGLYTAPSFPNTGLDTVQVTDSASNIATVQVSVCTPMELVCDIIQNQLGLSSGQVYLYNQKIDIPIDSQLYIAVGQLSCKPFSNNNSYAVVNGSYSQVQSTNYQALISIDILSRGPIARDQMELVTLALGSNYAESQMELNSFNIALLPTSFVNLSEVDGAAIPYRFNISAQLQYFISKTAPVSYFDSFQNPEVIPND
jgi:hypothetical protein